MYITTITFRCLLSYWYWWWSKQLLFLRRTRWRPKVRVAHRQWARRRRRSRPRRARLHPFPRRSPRSPSSCRSRSRRGSPTTRTSYSASGTSSSCPRASPSLTSSRNTWLRTRKSCRPTRRLTLSSITRAFYFIKLLYFIFLDLTTLHSDSALRPLNKIESSLHRICAHSFFDINRNSMRVR